MVWDGSSNLRWREAIDRALREAAKSRLGTASYNVFALEWVVARSGGLDERDAHEEDWVVDRMGFYTHLISSSSTKLDGGHTVQLDEGDDSLWAG
ncbi:putative type II PKS ketosynthase alpha subunit [Sesbania bispinosa]|nr:putative type II PKS ketosynthase alpha subunit [Sesbania bispinosa]